MTWRENKDDFARTIDMNNLPKRFGKKIKLGVDEAAIGFGMETKVWPANQILNIKNIRKEANISRIIFFSTKHHQSTLKGVHKPDTDQEPIRVKIDYRFGILGDSGADKLSKIFSEQMSISKSLLNAYLERDHKGKWKNILDGVTHENKKESEIHERIRSKTEESLNDVGGEIGISFSVAAIRVKKSRREKSNSKKATNEQTLDDFDADVDTEATFDVVNDPQVRQSAKEDRIQTIREEMKAKEEDKRNEIQRAKERKEEEHNQEMLSIRSEGETQRKIKRLAAREEKKREDSSRFYKEQEDRAQEAIEKRLTKIVKDNPNEPLESQHIIFQLADEKADLEGFMSNLRFRLRMGAYQAHQIESYISELEEISNGRKIDNDTLSNIFACLGELHRHRGDKGSKMDGYISSSLSLNGKNTYAIMTKLDFLWERTPQQFHPSKVKKFEHQLMEIRNLLEELELIDNSLFESRDSDLAMKQDILHEAILNLG